MSFIIVNDFRNPFKDIFEVEGNGSGPVQYIFVASNETRKKEVLNALARQPITGEVMMAISWLFAFNILAVRGTENCLSERKN